MNQEGLTLSELEDIINDPAFYEDAESANIVVLPPEADYLTDEDEADEDIVGIANVYDVPGELELQYTSSEAVVEKNGCDSEGTFKGLFTHIRPVSGTSQFRIRCICQA